MIDIGAKTLIQYGLVAIALIGFCWSLVLWGESRKQQEWDASLMEQASKTATAVIAAAENTAKVETAHSASKEKTRTITKVVKQEVIRYVQTSTPSCELGSGFESLFDRISGVLDADGERMPTTDSAAAVASVSDAGAITGAEVLSAYTEAITRWREERDRNRALSEWVTTTYETNRLHATSSQ